jgi:hypothetical protein
MNRYEEKLNALQSVGMLRSLPQVEQIGNRVVKDGREMLNLSSNDYLGIADRMDFREEFLSDLTAKNFRATSSSSRLLTGNFPSYDRLEKRLCELYHRDAALIFNSGYHANIGILPAITDSHTLILADKLVHASIVDGINLSKAKCIRYRHNRYDQLTDLLEKSYSEYEQIIVVTESIFSMDGDRSDLLRLTALKKQYPSIMLYVDEAHAVGVCGQQGLGCCEELGIIPDIDFLVGTFGKALASAGAFVICSQTMKSYLINTMRSLIFTTALPPVVLDWCLFVLNKVVGMQQEREYLQRISRQVQCAVETHNNGIASESHIVPFLCGSAEKAVNTAVQMQRKGFYLLPVRPPTVPEGTSRLRISLNAGCTPAEIDTLIHEIQQVGL